MLLRHAEQNVSELVSSKRYEGYWGCGLYEAVLLELLHLRPRGGDIGRREARVVDQVQVHIIHTELREDRARAISSESKLKAQDATQNVLVRDYARNSGCS